MNVPKNQQKKHKRGIQNTMFESNIHKPALLVLIGILTLPLIAYTTYRSHTAFRDTMVTQAQQQLLTIAKITAQGVEEFITTPSSALQLVARFALSPDNIISEDSSLPPRGTHMPLDIISQIYGKGIDAVFLLDTHGNLVHAYPHSHNENLNERIPDLDRQGVAFVRDQHRSYVGNAFFNQHAELTFSISEPVLDEQYRFIGIAQRVINLDKMAERLIEPVILRDRECAWLFDDRDVILSHPFKNFIGQSITDIISQLHAEIGEHFHDGDIYTHISRSHAYFNEIKNKKEGVGIYKSCKTYDRELVAYKALSIGNRRWGLVVTLPYHEIAGPINEHAQKVFAMACLFILLFWTGIVLLSHGKKQRIELEAEAKYLKQIARSAQKLREGEKRFRDLVENSLMGILIIQEGFIVYSNPEQERILGRLPQKTDILDLKNIHPADREEFKLFYQRILSGEARMADTETRFHTMDNSSNNGEIKWVHCRASLINYQGKKAILVNMMDITRAKELEHLVLMKQKMVSLGHVAAGIAHEIRNPLSGINIHLSALQKTFRTTEGLDETLRQRVAKITEQLLSASNRIELVIRKVMDFAKPSQPKLTGTNMNDAITRAMDLSSVTLRKSGISLQTELTPDPPPCKADSHLIEQVLLNLITNAAQAMKNVEGEKLIKISSTRSDDHIIIKVSDSGPGIPAEGANKIFDPFYTTKSDSSGIGLSLSHRIITDHRGTLEVMSSQWGGAEFKIELPLSKEATTT